MPSDGSTPYPYSQLAPTGGSDKVAAATAFLALPEASYIMGQIIQNCGGFR